MDDTTRQTLDALADLYLTNTAPSSSRDADADASAADADAQAARDARDPATASSPARLSPKVHAAGDGPGAHGRSLIGAASAPFAHAPQQAAARTDDGDRPPSQAAHPATLGLASFELDNETSAPDDDEQPLQEALPRLRTEAVFLGNLPGFGGPWLAQYAHQLALQRGPVAVLHLDRYSIDMELICTQRQPAPTVDIAGRSLIEMLAEMMAWPHQPVRTLLVHLDPANAVDLSRAADLPRWTFCCGADGAAVVGAYRLLRQLTEAAANSSRRGDHAVGQVGGPETAGMERRRIGVMVMGSDEPRAVQAAEKLSAAADSFAGVEIELTGWQQQMTPVNLQVIGAFDADGDRDAADRAWASLLQFLRDVDEIDAQCADEQPDTTASKSGEDAVAPPAAVDDGDGDDGGHDVPAPPQQMASSTASPAQPDSSAGHPTPGQSLSPSRPARPEPSSERSLPTADETHGTVTAPAEPPSQQATVASVPFGDAVTPDEPVKEPTMTSQAASPQTAAEHSPLGAFFEDDPLATIRPTASASRTPDAAAAPTGADPDLCAYLEADAAPNAVALDARCPQHPQTQLALDDRGRLHLLRRHAAGGADLRTAMVDLMQARAWCHEHLSLLQLTQRQLRFDSHASPVLHLFTDDARAAVGLAARLGDALKLHLLIKVGQGEHAIWHQSALN